MTSNKARQLLLNKKLAVLERDYWSCHYCAEPLSLETLTFDHIVPKAFGGSMRRWNLVAACGRCNGNFGCTMPKCGCQWCTQALGLFRTERHWSAQTAEAIL